MQMLHAPVVVDKLHGEPVEEVGLRRARAANSKIEYVVNERSAKVTQPGVVDGNSRSQGVVRADDPTSERQPPAGAGFREGLADRSVIRIGFFQRGASFLLGLTGRREIL